MKQVEHYFEFIQGVPSTCFLSKITGDIANYFELGYLSGGHPIDTINFFNSSILFDRIRE